MDQTDLAKKFFNDCHTKANYFGDTVLESECWGKQLEIKQALRDFDYVAVQSSHGVGKTYLAADVVLEFLFTHRNSYVITTATTAQQVRNILWAEINAKHSKSRLYLDTIYPSACLQTELKLDSQWKAIGLSPRKDTGTEVATSIQGFHAEDLLVVIDEAGGVEQAIWDSIYGVLTSKNCKLLAIGNPTHVGTEFYRVCKNKPKGWKVMSINSLDLPNVKVYGEFPPTKEGVTKLVEAYEKDPNKEIPFPRLTTVKWIVDRFYHWGYDNPLFQSRVLGRFPEKAEDSVYNATDVENAQLTINELPNNNIGRVLGIDVARFGDDKSVFCVYQNNKLIHMEWVQGKDTVQVANIAKKLFNDFDCTTIGVDDTGVGGGVTDNLRHDNYPCAAFNAANSAFNSQDFDNIKAEMHFALAREFKEGNIDLSESTIETSDLDNIKADLLNIKYEITRQGKLIIVSKEKMKKKGIPSPDHAEALMIAYYTAKYASGSCKAMQINTSQESSMGIVDYEDF